jgi:insertion element IS1 protein InsB
VWIWKAIDKFTRQVIDFELGDRSAETLKPMIERLKKRKVFFYHTDGYQGYNAVIDETKLYQGKDETVQIERSNARLRHFFARFKRRTCVVSKKLERVMQAVQIFSTLPLIRTC